MGQALAVRAEADMECAFRTLAVQRRRQALTRKVGLLAPSPSATLERPTTYEENVWI